MILIDFIPRLTAYCWLFNSNETFPNLSLILIGNLNRTIWDEKYLKANLIVKSIDHAKKLSLVGELGRIESELDQQAVHDSFQLENNYLRSQVQYSQRLLTYIEHSDLITSNGQDSRYLFGYIAYNLIGFQATHVRNVVDFDKKVVLLFNFDQINKDEWLYKRL